MDGLTLLQVLGGCVDELQGDKLEAALFKAGNDVSDKTALDAVGLSYTMQPMRCCLHQHSAQAKKKRRAFRVMGRTLTMMYVRSLLEGMADTVFSG